MHKNPANETISVSFSPKNYWERESHFPLGLPDSYKDCEVRGIQVPFMGEGKELHSHQREQKMWRVKVGKR